MSPALYLPPDVTTVAPGALSPLHRLPPEGVVKVRALSPLVCYLSVFGDAQHPLGTLPCDIISAVRAEPRRLAGGSIRVRGSASPIDTNNRLLSVTDFECDHPHL